MQNPGESPCVLLHCDRLEDAVLLESRIHTFAILGAHEIEQQTAKERQREAHSRPRPRIGRVTGLTKGDDSIEPLVNQSGQEGGIGFLPSAGAGIALEEQPLRRPQLWIAEPLPHGQGHLLGWGVERLEETTLILFDTAHDVGEEAVARTEVVDEHAVARPDYGRDVAQGSVANPAALELGHDRVEELLPSHSARVYHSVHVPLGTPRVARACR